MRHRSRIAPYRMISAANFAARARSKIGTNCAIVRRSFGELVSRTIKTHTRNEKMISSIISWMVFGLVIGLIARMLYPGRQAMGIFATMLLGIAGSLVGGFISWAMGFHPEEGAFR